MNNLDTFLFRIDRLIGLRFPGMTVAFELAIVGVTKLKEFGERDNAVVDKIVDLGFPLDLRDRTQSDQTFDPTAQPSHEEIRIWLNSVFAYRIELEEQRPAEIAVLYERAMVTIKAQELEQARDRDRDKFFSEPGAAADMVYWRGLAYWTLDEAVALSFDKDPKVVNERKLGGPHNGSPFRREYRRRKEIVARAIRAKQLPKPMSPASFVKWLRVSNTTIESTAFESGGAPPDVPPEDKIDSRDVGSLYKLILAMAVKHYGYPLNSSDMAPSITIISREISNVLKEMNIELGEKTIAKHLRIASEKAQSKGGAWTQGRFLHKWK